MAVIASATTAEKSQHPECAEESGGRLGDEGGGEFSVVQTTRQSGHKKNRKVYFSFFWGQRVASLKRTPKKNPDLDLTISIFPQSI